MRYLTLLWEYLNFTSGGASWLTSSRRSMLDALIQNNPSLQVLLDINTYMRNGLFRASSTFMTPLAFGEFEMILIPIGLFFALQREKLLEKCLGWMVVFGGIVGIFVSGSRGAYLGFLISTAVFLVAWPIRTGAYEQGKLGAGFRRPCGRVLVCDRGRADCSFARSP